jgi:phage gpG-like protein
MRFSFRGEFAELNRWADKISRTPDALPILSQQLAEETVELVRDGFATARDPYGRTWAPLVMRAGRPLSDTGALRASWHTKRAGAQGFAVASSRNYAAYHQLGTGIHGPRRERIRPIRGKALKLPGGVYLYSVAGSPPRKMVPDPGHLPEPWRRRYIDVAHEVFTELFR